MQERALQSVVLGKPTGARAGHGGVHVQEEGGYVAEGEVGDDVLLSNTTGGLGHDTMTHPCELGGREGGRRGGREEGREGGRKREGEVGREGRRERREREQKGRSEGA